MAERVLTGDFTRQLRDMTLEDSGGMLRLMTIGNTGGWRNFANTKRRIQTPADLSGLKMRTVVADLPQELVRALDASPTPIPGRNCSPRCRPTWSRAPRTASPTSCRCVSPKPGCNT